MTRTAGIDYRKPFLLLRMSEPEARDLLALLDGVDGQGGRKMGMRQQVRHYERLAQRLRKAKIRFPPRATA
jgi:hypothetical protein